MTFPVDSLDIRVRLYLLGEWVDMGPMASAVEDFYTDEYLDEFLGRIVWDNRRLPDQEIGIVQGSSDESSAAEPAEVSVVLWNDDGYLTPKDPRSPWWANDTSGWGKNTPLQILVDGTVVFWGEVSEIVPEWPEGDMAIYDETLFGGAEPEFGGEEVVFGGGELLDAGYSRVTVTASGILRRMGQGQRALKSPLRRLATKSTNVVHVSDYWPMEDGPDSGFIASGLPASTVPVPYRMSFRDLSMSSDDTLGGSGPLPNVSAGNSAVWAATVRGDASYSAGFSTELFFRIPQAPTEAADWCRLIDLDCSGTVARWGVEIGFDTAPFIRVVSFDGSGDIIESTPNPDPTDVLAVFSEDWQQLRLDLSPGSGVVDWTVTVYSVTTGVDSGFAFSGSVSGTQGLPTLIRGAITAAPGGVSIGHLILHDGIPGGWLVPADTGWVAEKALSRMDRLAREEDIPFTSDQVVTGETTPMGRQLPGQLMDLLAECAASDAGILCEQRDAVGLHYRTRRFLYNADPVLTLDANESQIANPFVPADDDQKIRNDVTVSRIGGSSYNLVDAASAAPPEDGGHGIYEESYDLSLASDLVLHHHTGWRLHLGTFDGIRYPEITVDLGLCPDLIATWLTVRVGDRVRITNLPPQHPTGDVDLIVRGWTETLSPFSWMVTLNCSPAKPYDVGRWAESRWAPRESYLTSALNATATTFNVTTPGIKWTTNGARFPVDVLIGGCEQATVTAITGTSPQAFVATRGVNGLARAHAAGAPVELYEPPVLGL